MKQVKHFIVITVFIHSFWFRILNDELSNSKILHTFVKINKTIDTKIKHEQLKARLTFFVGK